MSACYILYSIKLDKFYIGVTQEGVQERLIKHNSKHYGAHRFTATADDWELFLNIPTENYNHAIRIERKIKGMKSSNYIRNLKKYPELLKKIVTETLQSN